MSASNPVVAEPDWPGLRILFASGESLAKLAQATGIPVGTLHSRSSREKWDEDRKRVKVLASQAREKTHLVLASMPERARNHVSRVAEQTDRHLVVLEQETISTLSDVERNIKVLDQVDKVARRSYDLDADSAGNKTIVNLGFLSDYRDPVIPAVDTTPMLEENAL